MNVEMIGIRQIEPEEKLVNLEGMYLGHNLQELAKTLGRPVVIANYVTDLKDVIAVKNVRGAPEKLKDPGDWRLFQELVAQADINITGQSYLDEFSKTGGSQDVITQFEQGADFEKLGDWREQNGLKRNLDVAVVSRSLKFEIPKELLDGKRQIFVFTTNRMADSDKAKALDSLPNVAVVPAGDEKDEGVDGAKVISELGKMKNEKGERKYKVIKMTTGPTILKILLDANVLDRLYITRVNRTITDDLSTAVTVLESKRVDDLINGEFKLIERYLQEKVTKNDGFTTSQEFLVYEKA